MKSPQRPRILLRLWMIAFAIAILMGVSLPSLVANAETATITNMMKPPGNTTVLDKIPYAGQCPKPLLEWAIDDKQNKRFFLVAPLDSEQGTLCRNALESNKTRDVNDLKKTYEDTFSDRFKDVSYSPINNCPLPNGEDGVLTTSKYFTALRRIDEGLSRVIDEATSINATLPNTPFDESFCDNSFKTHGPKCASYKEACKKMATDEEYDALAKDAAAAADHVFCVGLVDNNCKYTGGGEGLANSLKNNGSPQLRQCLNVLSDDASKIFARPDLLNKTFCDSKRNKEVIDQTIATYPFLFGSEFKKTVNTDSTVQPNFSKNDALKGFDISGPVAGKFPFDPKQVKKAMTNQLAANRDGLRETKKDLESAYYCLTGQKISNNASRDDCSPEFLRRVTNGVYMGEENRIQKNDSRRSAIELYQCQQNVIERHTERDQLASMSHEGLVTLGVTGASIITGGLTAPAAVARISSFSRLARLAIGAAVVTAEVGMASSSINQAYESCIKGKPQVALTLAPNKALDGKSCPSQSTSASQAARMANSCYLDSVFVVTDSLSAGLASRTAKNFGNALRESSRGSSSAGHAAANTRGAGGGADASEVAAAKPGPPDGIERRHPEVVHQSNETSKYHRSPNREKAIAENGNRHISADKNETWAKATTEAKPGGKTRFLDIQNLFTKWLNDTTLDKDLVTALNNKHADLSEAKVQALLKKHPEVRIAAVKKSNSLPAEEVEAFAKAHPSVKKELEGPLSDETFIKMIEDHPEMKEELEAFYEDFKSQRYAFEPVPPAKSIPGSWEKDLDQGLKEVNDEFAKYVQENKLVRESGEAGNWFRAGYGETGDQANLATRYSKKQDENRLYSFNEKKVQKALKETMSQAEGTRQSLKRDLKDTTLWDSDGGVTLKTEVFELVRKSNNPEELRAQISKSLSVEITSDQARRIMSYAKAVDEFSPGINVIQREVASLAGADKGGINIDFKGMGGKNLKATAEALAGNKRSLNGAIQGAREGEQAVTASFNKMKEEIDTIVRNIAKENGIEVDIKASGDDMVIIPNKPMSQRVRDQISDALAKKMDPSSIRMSTIPAGIAAESRGTLGTIGESIEKQLRKNLQGIIPKERLDQLLFRIDMKNPNSNTTATLNTSTSTTRPNSTEQSLIDKAFRDAVNDVKTKADPTTVKPKSLHYFGPQFEWFA